jgi:phosphoglycerate kinase
MTLHFTSLKNLDLTGKTVLLRADLNVPAHQGKVTDTTRIDRLKPTIDHLRSQGARIIILSHFGRPDGAPAPGLSLAFLLPALEKSWGAAVRFARDCGGAESLALKTALQNGEIGLLENVRFYPGEEKNAPDFIRTLAALGDVYVNDAFSAAHRAHASTEGLAHALPSAAGLLMEEELLALDAALGNPKRPVAAFVGGSKVSTKLSVLNNLVAKVDILILGGGMANTFIAASGGSIGSSLCEHDMAAEAKAIMDKAEAHNCRIILPIDAAVAKELKTGAVKRFSSAQNIESGDMAVDIGPKSIEAIQSAIQNCKTIVWNGPMGVFEIKPFDEGTNALALRVAEGTKSGQWISIAGGGDTVSALENAGAADDFTYISTAGGAFLEWLEGKTLPGVRALANNKA